jgi:hypothetical protein
MNSSDVYLLKCDIEDIEKMLKSIKLEILLIKQDISNVELVLKLENILRQINEKASKEQTTCDECRKRKLQ